MLVWLDLFFPLCMQLWDMEELLSGPQVANGDEPAEAGSDDSDDDSDDDVMDVDMAATSSKGENLSRAIFFVPLAW